MQDTPEIFLESNKFQDKEIFKRIVTSPRQVFRFINNTGYDKFVIPLLVLSGISRSLDKADQTNMGDKTSLWIIIITCILGGGLFGWITTSLYALLVNWTGKWLKGQGTTKSILMMFSYALTPQVIALLLIIPQIVIYGKDIFRREDVLLHYSSTSIAVFYLALSLNVILGVWTVFLMVVGTSEVQKLSIGKAILNLVLPVLVMMAIALTMILLFKLFTLF